jgi:hypothetical protein
MPPTSSHVRAGDLHRASQLVHRSELTTDGNALAGCTDAAPQH